MLIFTGATLRQRLIISFIFALGGSFLFMGLMKKIKFQNSLFIPLIGMMLGNVVGSITTFIAYQTKLVQNINSWTQGSFTNILRGNFELIYIGLPFIIIAFLYAGRFTIAGMGEDFSKNLGLNYNTVVNIGIIIVSIISASIVVTIGSIPFIGLIVPNMVTMWLGDNLKKNLGITAIVGALFLLICDIIGRLVIFPFEVPISLVVGTIGSIIFLGLLLRRKNYAS
jgi:iron complex transport system permease protein